MYFVLAVSQLAHILVVAVITALLFFVLGLILLSPNCWRPGPATGPATGQLLGMTIPVPQALIQITMFFAALTFMYISARAVGDADYRARFFDPLIDDLRITLDARNRYRERRSGALTRDGSQFRAQYARVRHAGRSTSGFSIAGCRWF